MLTLRPYQSESIAAIRDYWNEGGEHGILVLATGTGKSLVQATIAKDLIEEFQGFRVVCVTHVMELIVQNMAELLAIWPFAPCGIYSASLGRRDSQSQVLFCGVQSVWDKTSRIGHTDLLIIDEAHLLPPNANTRYAKFIMALLAINPDMRVLGLTATDYRTDSGRLTEGEDRLFSDVVYEYGIADGIRDGYLAPLVSKATGTTFDLSGVQKRGGDYVPGSLQAACDKDETTRSAVDEILVAGADRKTWLAFCAGVTHAEHVRDEIRSRGITCEMITGDTPKNERQRFISDFKSGKIRALTNNSVLTTGLNIPGIDLIADLRPTMSAGLFVQIAGRGTRPVYAKGFDLNTTEGRLAAIAAGTKPNCLYMDFSGNVEKRHGPVDLVKPRKPGEGGGEAPCKLCDNCHSLVHISAKVCPDCGFEFPINDKPKHAAVAATAAILSKDVVKTPPPWLKVQSRKFTSHRNAAGDESVRVEFLANFVSYSQWLSIKKSKNRSDKFWRDHAGQMPYPADVEEWLERDHELKDTSEIQIRPSQHNKRYFEIVGLKAALQHNTTPKAREIQANRFGYSMDDDIPF
jgi:DNA repair protein RadD